MPPIHPCDHRRSGKLLRTSFPLNLQNRRNSFLAFVWNKWTLNLCSSKIRKKHAWSADCFSLDYLHECASTWTGSTSPNPGILQSRYVKRSLPAEWKEIWRKLLNTIPKTACWNSGLPGIPLPVSTIMYSSTRMALILCHLCYWYRVSNQMVFAQSDESYKERDFKVESWLALADRQMCQTLVFQCVLVFMKVKNPECPKCSWRTIWLFEEGP